MSLGKAIRYFRIEAKLTQEQVSERSGVHPTLISRLEHGDGNPTHQTIHRLADGLGVPCAWILTLEEIYESTAED